jgi:phosphatidylglycerophosphate synthase
MAYALLAYFTPGLTGSPPPWAFYLAAVLMFFYQTLDAIDGKQARRTGSNSPLGQLFDHGCDAICAIFHGLFSTRPLRVVTPC